MAAMYEGEMQKRVAMLRRLRELLLDQRGKFENYLTVLDHEKGDIESGDVDRLVAHVEIEEAIVSEIFTFQKAIDPLEDLMRSALPAGDTGWTDVGGLKDSLQDLKSEVLKRNEENRSLLRARMDVIRSQLLALRKPLGSRRSVYAEREAGSLVDMGA
ncbi:MAG TPA: flagellar biosynthesis protein FlgN [Rectinemataceae bacterium]|nr:flagellar biosynthesis protein FlgN [Rectinemataceae bacterium]